MQTERVITGTCVGEVERADRKEMVWVSLVKGGKIATLDGMFSSAELRYIADWLD